MNELETTPPSLREILDRHRALVCVGSGGVGKTTVAAALGLAAALQGQRVMVLTIDPAQQLARALGVSDLRRGGAPVELSTLTPVGHALGGELHAAMLDQRAAWDAFITRHAPNPSVRQTLLANPFYRQMSTSLAGSTEYMAIEELCHLDESGAYDLVVIDTPPASHALDFLRAPQRIERLLQPEVLAWVLRGTGVASSGATRATGAVVRRVLRRLERAAGSSALREVTAFFAALQAMLSDVAARTARARALLRGESTAFVLVTGAAERVLAFGDELMVSLRQQQVPLRAVIANRVHRLPDCCRGVLGPGAEERARGLPGIEPATGEWLSQCLHDAVVQERFEQQRLAAFRSALPSGLSWAEAPDLERGDDALSDLREIARYLGALAQP